MSVGMLIEQNDFIEFEELVWYARANHTPFLGLIIERTYFFAKYLDSRRCNPQRKQITKGNLANDSKYISTSSKADKNLILSLIKTDFDKQVNFKNYSSN